MIFFDVLVRHVRCCERLNSADMLPTAILLGIIVYVFAGMKSQLGPSASNGFSARDLHHVIVDLQSSCAWDSSDCSGFSGS